MCPVPAACCAPGTGPFPVHSPRAEARGSCGRMTAGLRTALPRSPSSCPFLVSLSLCPPSSVPCTPFLRAVCPDYWIWSDTLCIMRLVSGICFVHLWTKAGHKSILGRALLEKAPFCRCTRARIPGIPGSLARQQTMVPAPPCSSLPEPLFLSDGHAHGHASSETRRTALCA